MVDDAGIQRWVREALTRQPPDRMPDDVREQILQDLRREQTARTAARNPARRWLLPAAAASALVLAGAAAWPQFRGTDTEPALAAAACPITVAPGTDLSPVAHQTGRRYTAAGLPDLTRSLLPAADGCGSSSGSSGSPAAAVPAEAKTSAGDSAAGADLAACLVSIIPGQTVIAVDRGFYRGEEVVVAITSTQPRRILVVDCTPPPAAVMYRTDLP